MELAPSKLKNSALTRTYHVRRAGTPIILKSTSLLHSSSLAAAHAPRRPLNPNTTDVSIQIVPNEFV